MAFDAPFPYLISKVKLMQIFLLQVPGVRYDDHSGIAPFPYIISNVYLKQMFLLQVPGVRYEDHPGGAPVPYIISNVLLMQMFLLQVPGVRYDDHSGGALHDAGQAQEGRGSPGQRSVRGLLQGNLLLIVCLNIYTN
jgi:hypothetical protein